jgi:hypothetical protein
MTLQGAGASLSPPPSVCRCLIEPPTQRSRESTFGRPFCLINSQKETPTLRPEFSRKSHFEWSDLLQRAVDRCELRIEVGADAIHRDDDRNRNAGCDQSVLNRGSSRLVFPEFANELLHVMHPSCHVRLGEREILIKTT